MDFVDGEPEGAHGTGLWLGSLTGDGTTAMLTSGGENAILEPNNRSPLYLANHDDHDAWLLGVRTPALAGARFDLVVERDGGTERTPVPTFRVPGFDHDVWFVALTDPEVDHATWPFAFIEVTAQDGTTSQWSLDGLELEASGADAPAIQVAENVQVVETDIGPATDLGVTVEDLQLGNPNQALRYILSVTTVGEMAPEAADLTPEERAGPAVLLSMLAADGTALNGSGWYTTRRATSDGSPMYQSGLSDHDVYVLGRLSPGSGATLELVVEHAAGAERTLIPAFRLPGLPDDFFFVALHHDEVTVADWPTIYLELTARDGAIRRWTLAGIELSEDVPKSTDVPTDQG